ncbi:SpoVA/SpoVAEb family sporulation membrane protein [Parageobacillus toebii]|uniref:Stage V sporulation protein AE n=2 Tax=Parageobacillus toebii TaxID=153151 RepID=A0AA89NMV0_9BACL|nr:SpoVA/SpoVAEb family sporulation membrane protein [Parageobacillus toebii]MBB3867309.1 stage V sporulation protein AE [Parageobacillus toebii NBRC 107807]MED4969873.1 SpoVA/SpoVAEb family sporulation membrane protein [Parageobacillus toebii]
MMDYVMAFIVGGAICAIAQSLMDIGKISQMKMMSLLVAVGAILGISGIYDRLIAIAGAGASLPITGFGYFLIKGVLVQKESNGWLAIGAGMFQFAGAILSFTIVLSFFTALICRPKG